MFGDTTRNPCSKGPLNCSADSVSHDIGEMKKAESPNDIVNVHNVQEDAQLGVSIPAPSFLHYRRLLYKCVQLVLRDLARRRVQEFRETFAEAEEEALIAREMVRQRKDLSTTL